MAISANLVKELREKSGAGMMDCKKALEETQGDLEKALDFLRKKGLGAAAKKSARITSEGKIVAWNSGKSDEAILAEVNCETDFVARNPDFIEFTDRLLQHILANKPQVVKAEEGPGALLDQTWIDDANYTVAQHVSNLIAKIGENISPRRFEHWTLQGAGRFQTYIHMNGKYGVVVEIGCPAEIVENEDVKFLAKQLSLHIAAINPLSVDRESVPADLLAREREIAISQVPPEKQKFAEKIIEGKLQKFFKDQVLLEQEWVHDSEKSVKKVVEEVSKKAGGQITVRRYLRWQLGEGLAKRSNDLAAEVAAQLEGK